MRTAHGPKPASAEYALAGFVTLSKWSLVAPAIEHQLREHPGESVALECGRVTGFAPGAYFALARLLESAPGRVRLLNWPAPVSRAVVPLVLVTQVLDGLVADLTETSRLVSRSTRAELDESVTHLAARVAELKQNWLGASAQLDLRAPRPLGAPGPL
ncbi:hypothetical protein J8F10_09915 [Gemmata sp. G18]|uniref:Uncharacterized protein n=1 Tax=Gemmata palustris TaxID=2822762 RepID=A0ABS5BPD8_9BACT|nr:hypothetical protein [Gemmata palustris]MBP3955597.1 hypothetical protein [Gemmata palustris]